MLLHSCLGTCKWDRPAEACQCPAGEDKSRSERLADRAYVEPGFWSVGHIICKIGHPVAAAEENFAILGDSHRSTKQPRLSGPVEVLINTASNSILLGRILREAESRQKSNEREPENSDSHARRRFPLLDRWPVSLPR